ncbi:hypothetical protein [Pseudoneobacillus sp. C159]
MPKENTKLTNSIQYSIWETKTNENQPGIAHGSAKSAEEMALESNKPGKQV